MKRIAFGLFAALALCAPAIADIAVTPGTGGTAVNLIDFTGATTPAGTARCASTNHCAATAVIDTAGLPVTGPLGTPSVSALTVQGGAGGTPLTISNQTGTSTPSKITIASTSTYQQALASNSSRKGCTIQYIAVAGTKGFVIFAGSAPGDTTTSFQLGNGDSVNCQTPGMTIPDAIQVTATIGDIFVVTQQ